MITRYRCCICHTTIEKNKRLVYQEFDNKKPYGVFHDKYNYDFCDKCFRIFTSWVVRYKDKNDLKLGVEAVFKKER